MGERCQDCGIYFEGPSCLHCRPPKVTSLTVDPASTTVSDLVRFFQNKNDEYTQMGDPLESNRCERVANAILAAFREYSRS